MPNYAKYKKKFRKEWLGNPVFKGWLDQDPKDEDRAFCTVCSISLRAHKTDLINHSKNNKHKRNFSRLNPKKDQKCINPTIVISNNTKRSELVIAMYIAIHSSIKSVDHLSQILQKDFRLKQDDTSSKNIIRLHRTKCSMLIQNVIGATFKEDLIVDIGNSPYSLIIDESTDVSVQKYLCLCIRYFSEVNNKLVTTYLGIVNVVNGTAVALADVIKNYLQKQGLKIENLIGLGTDGANVLCGQHNSVFTILKKDAPRLTLVKCVAHSLHLCCAKAASVLPADLDFLCKQIYNWFSQSNLRRDAYKHIFDLINSNENTKFHNFVQLSETRWLERANVIKIILEQWLEIKTYFDQILNDSMAKVITTMLTDLNFVYFTVVYNIIIQVNVVNAAFQQSNGDAFQLYNELYSLLLTLLRIVIRPIFLENLNNMTRSSLQKISDILNNELAYIPVNVIDFGYNYRQSLEHTHLSLNNTEILKSHCQNYVLVLCKELVQRIPSNFEVFQSIKYFSPALCLKQINRPKLSDLPCNFLPNNVDKQILENEWNHLLSVEWNLPENTSSEEFWIRVLLHQNAGGIHIFVNIAKFALTTLSLPISNAFVERIFSFMNILKTKLRNKMHVPLLDSLLRIKTEFVINNMCCANFEPSQQMFRRFNTSMYDFKQNKLEVEVAELFEVFPDIQF